MIPESTTPGRRVSWPALLAMVLAPLLAVGGLIGMAGTSRASSQVQAAIVNLDQAVTIDGQYTPLGRQLAAAMIERDGENISWTLADAKNAKDGLATGRYSAVVTIPEEFSAAATSFSSGDAADARQATIDVKVSENAPVTDAKLAQEIARLAKDTVNNMLTEGFVDGIFVGFNTVGEQFTTIVDAASQLSDGASQLADGTGEVSDGLTQLSDGMVLLAGNAAQLNDGGAQLAEGVGLLANNAGTLTDGGAQLADGSSQLAAGAAQLNSGVSQLTSQLPQLVDGVGQLTDGAEQLLGGLPAYTDGVVQVVGGVAGLQGGLDQAVAGLDQLDQLSAGAIGLSDGLGQVNQLLTGYSTGAVAAPAEVTGAADQISAAIASQFQCPVADQATCQLLAQVFAQGAGAGAAAGVDAGFKAGTGVGVAAFNTPDASGTTLLDGSAQLAGGVQQLAEQLPAGLQQISDGAAALVQGAQPLVDNAPALSAGSTELLGGMQQLDQQLQALPAGADQLAAGIGEFTNGVVQLDDGLGAYVDGVAQYADGVVQLADGVETYVSGVGQYTAGVVSAADGVTELATGFVQLDEGAEQLADGLGTFATEMASGADQVPSFSAEQRESLAGVVAGPVSTPDDLTTLNTVGLASLLVVAGLWLAGIASYVVARAVPSDVVSSRAPSVVLWARTIGLPAAMVAALGAVLGVIAAVVTDLSFGRTLGLVVLLAGIGAVFVFVNHALAAWLGNIGRGISLVLLVASVALGVTSAVPGWLSTVAGISPLQSGLELTRTWMASGSGLVGLFGAVLLAGCLALGFSYLAIASRRQLSADQFRRRLATS